MCDYSIGVIGDEETIKGLKIGGVEDKGQNIIKVTEEDSKKHISTQFYSLINNKSIVMIFISEFAADKIKNEIDDYDRFIPSILKIPSRKL
ncbi:VATF [Hepatospora eriocheir]|uniref:VATF n=1 Tax=Hepatospora eriocheir TaxID=1081669 RepID=A0A1X0QH33_9MICR|nr:VATF [Hepatospora eriocheir]